MNYHFLSDSPNRPWTIRLMKIGGGDAEHGRAEGIHWHMNIASTVEYIHTDSVRQVIPWVRVTSPDGRVTVYQSESEPLTPEQVDSAEIRTMDCIDCHIRPSHIYSAPARAVNVAMGTGRISTTLPSTGYGIGFQSGSWKYVATRHAAPRPRVRSGSSRSSVCPRCARVAGRSVIPLRVVVA